MAIVNNSISKKLAPPTLQIARTIFVNTCIGKQNKSVNLPTILTHESHLISKTLGVMAN